MLKCLITQSSDPLAGQELNMRHHSPRKTELFKTKGFLDSVHNQMVAQMARIGQKNVDNGTRKKRFRSLGGTVCLPRSSSPSRVPSRRHRNAAVVVVVRIIFRRVRRQVRIRQWSQEALGSGLYTFTAISRGRHFVSSHVCNE